MFITFLLQLQRKLSIFIQPSWQWNMFCQVAAPGSSGALYLSRGYTKHEKLIRYMQPNILLSSILFQVISLFVLRINKSYKTAKKIDWKAFLSNKELTFNVLVLRKKIDLGTVIITNHWRLTCVSKILLSLVVKHVNIVQLK